MSSAPPTSIATDAVEMIFNLLEKTLVIAADDGVTLLQPGDNLDVVKGPYPQEGAGNEPEVIVGPRNKPSTRKPLTFPKVWYEIDDFVPVLVIARDWDGGDLGFTLDGRAARAKILENVWQTLAANSIDPDGTGTWKWVRAADNGVDDDAIGGESKGTSTGAVNIYRTTLTIACRRYSQVD